MKTDGSRRRLTRGRHLAALSVLVLACSISPTAATCSGEAIFEAPDGAISVVPDDAVRTDGCHTTPTDVSQRS